MLAQTLLIVSFAVVIAIVAIGMALLLMRRLRHRPPPISAPQRGDSLIRMLMRRWRRDYYLTDKRDDPPRNTE